MILYDRILLIASILCISHYVHAHNASFPLPDYKIHEYPFNMVGRVARGDTYDSYSISSGVAISQKVVLSAAHIFFNRSTLDWDTGFYKWKVRYTPADLYIDKIARSYRYFDDYALARRNAQFDDPRLYTLEQFNRDVITLIFYEDVADGGWAGWGANEMTDNSDKMIVGYPNLGYSYSDPRSDTMHSTSLDGSPARYKFVNYNDRFGSRSRLYETYDLSSGPGNSGGPVFGLIRSANSIVDWGVVGITVGGSSGESSLAVGIDQAVSDLIKASGSTDGSAIPSDDHADIRGAATPIELNRSISGNLEIEGDLDYFRFEIRSAGTITAFTTGDTDTFGELRNDLGNIITSNDDNGSGKNFFITRIVEPGIYYVDISNFSNNETGQYSFHVDFIETPVEEPSIDNHGDLVLGGLGHIVQENIQHPNGNVFDQILLTGPFIKLKAKQGQITRVSFMDVNDDIVQVEFSGAGTFTVTLDPPTFRPASLPPRYNQAVKYVTGKPSIVIEGANFNTFFSIFTVGRINSVNQALFPSGQVYDAQANVTLVEVIDSTGMGGVQMGNAVFSGSTGKVGIDARGVPIAVRLTVGDIDASGDAVPYLLFGDGSFTITGYNTGLRIGGGDLLQSNGVPIVTAPNWDGLTSSFNYKSDGTELPVQDIKATWDFID